LTSGDLDLWPFQLIFSTPLIRALGNVYANFDFSTVFVFELQARTGQTDRQTDGRTDGQDAYNAYMGMQAAYNAAYRTVAEKKIPVSAMNSRTPSTWTAEINGVGCTVRAVSCSRQPYQLQHRRNQLF